MRRIDMERKPDNTGKNYRRFIWQTALGYALSRQMKKEDGTAVTHALCMLLIRDWVLFLEVV